MDRGRQAFRVLMITWEYPPWFTGGAGTACRGMVRSLLARGVGVSVFLPWAGVLLPDAEGNLSEAGMPVAVPFCGGYDSPVIPADIPLPGPETEFDILHCHDWPTFPAALELQRCSGRPLIVHIHSLESDRSPGGGNPDIAALEREGCLQADMVIAVSAYTAGKLTGEYGVDPDKIRVLYNGYELEEPLGPAKDYNPGGKRVLFLGRLAEQKGPEIFLEAASRLAEGRNDTVFLIAGAGPLETSLKEHPGMERFADKIVFTGFIPREDLSALLDSTNILVVPSLSEPFGIAGLEAMSRGVAVIVTRTAGLTEITRNVVALGRPAAGELAALLSRMLDTPEETALLGAAAAREAAGLTWEVRGEELIGLYETLLY